MSRAILEAQMKECELYAMWWHARIVSGEYKQRQMERGDHTPLTEEENLEDAINTMRAHLHRYSDLLNKLAASPLKRQL